MKRLFISLYLLISLSFLGLGWTLDTLWQQGSDDSPVDAPLHALATMLTPLSHEQRQQLIQHSSSSRYPLQLVDATQIVLAGKEQLQPDHIINTQVGHGKLLQFVLVGDQVLMAGPLDSDPRAGLRSIFTLCFYLMLAGVALIWVWPLSRDLQILRRATRALGEAKWDTRIALSNRSQVLPLAQTFNEMARQIKALIDNQRHLSNAVSHELRTPLARLKFAMALIPQYCHGSKSALERQQFIDGMGEDIQEMEALLQEMLTYARLESAKSDRVTENCQLAGLCQQVIDKLQPLSTIPIRFNNPAGNIDYIGEPNLIERALQNLLTNAQRFAQQQIEVRLQRLPEGIALQVIDDGEGISAADQQKIFTPFFRSDSERNSNKGFGLGLAIIQRIMERHNGHIQLLSHSGYTCFTLVFPTPATQGKNH